MTPTPAPTSIAGLRKGRTKHEVIRILKRYLAREIYKYLPRG